MSQQLGRLEKVDLRNIWSSESAEFTPWLAREENLEILGDALGLDLELEAQEKAVGPFRADILCKDVGSNAWVLIENQLERTDHIHLGQLLTYASGLEAVTIVWIAERFNEEHRSTLDWLNKITEESFRFFGLEVELWRIGDSLAAPKFNIISKPNNWSRSVAQAARVIDETELSETRLMQRSYWHGLNEVLEKMNGPVAGNRKPQPQSWMSYPVGRFNFSLGAVMVRPKRRIRTELSIGGEDAKSYFSSLSQDRILIEQEFGEALEWDAVEDRSGCRIAIYLNNVDPEDQSDWPRQDRWLAERLNKMHKVFANKVRSLTLVMVGIEEGAE